MAFTWASIAQLVTAALLITAVLIVSALGTTVCLTHKEARELWPKKHLYWYSKDRCWSDRKGPPRYLKMDPILDNKAQAPLPRPAKIKEWSEDYCCWPNIDDLKAYTKGEAK